MLKQVISGGQLGIDRIGIEVAQSMGIPTGGTAAKGWMTEKGPDFTLKKFGLKECDQAGYNPRTLKNVLDSDGTVLFGDMQSSGSYNTIRFCVTHKKPYITNPTPEQLISFVRDNNVFILNVAGNRASKLKKEQPVLVESILRNSFAVLVQ